MIRVLSDDGVRIEVIAGLVGGLNRRIFQRLWTLLAPEELRANSCLVVMGSEGRGEQIVKTDQDNALILRDGFAFDGLEAVTNAFTAALIEFGYPPCPGGIMLSRPLWCQPLEGFRAALRDWTHGSDPDGPMNLAIFLDAAAVAGDARLLDEAQAYLRRLLAGSDAFYARFAAAIEQFGGEGGWWRRLPGLRGRGGGGDRPEEARDLPAGAWRAHARAPVRRRGARHRGPAARPLGCRPDRRRRSPATSWTRCTA